MGAITDKIKGKLMKAEGRATNDPVRQGQGHVVEKKGKVKSAMNRAAAKVDAKVSGVRAKARRKSAAARRTP